MWYVLPRSRAAPGTTAAAARTRAAPGPPAGRARWAAAPTAPPSPARAAKSASTGRVNSSPSSTLHRSAPAAPARSPAPRAASARPARRSRRGAPPARAAAPRPRSPPAPSPSRPPAPRTSRRVRVRLGRGQRLAVQLAVRRQRQRLQPHVRRRHHVRRQPLGQVRAQRVRLRPPRRPPRTPPAACPPARPRAPRTTASRTPACSAQPRLDLAQLDAEAAHLHLVVVAAQELQRPVRQPAQPGRPSGTAAPPARRRTGRPRSAPPSAPAGPGTRAPPPAPPMYSSPATPTGTGSPRRVQHVDARVRRSAGPIGTLRARRGTVRRRAVASPRTSSSPSGPYS